MLLFFLGYTLLFLLWANTFLYTLPFLLGLLLAWMIQPVIQLICKHLHLPKGAASLIATIGVLVLAAGLLSLLGFLAIWEISQFLSRSAAQGFQQFSKPVADFLNQAGAFLEKLDLSFLEQHRQEILNALQSSMDFVVGCLAALLDVLTSLPTVFTLVVVTVCATFFLARDMEAFTGWCRSFFSPSAIRQVRAAVKHSGGTGRKYLLSYFFLYFLTFCETCIILAILGIPYPLLLGILTAVADVLPILGPGIVLAPVALYQVLLGEYGRALGILIGWGVISCLRQAIEPRLISSSTKLHPLVPLAAIYFSLVGKNFWILFYVLGLFTLYGTLRDIGTLPALKEEKASCKACSQEEEASPEGTQGSSEATKGG